MGRDLSGNEKICLSSPPMLLINHPLSLIKILVSSTSHNGGRTKITKIDKQSGALAKALQVDYQFTSTLRQSASGKKSRKFVHDLWLYSREKKRRVV